MQAKIYAIGENTLIRKTGEDMEITVKPRPRIFRIFMFCLWLCAWAVADVNLAAGIPSFLMKIKASADPGFNLMMIIMFCIWTAAGIAVLFTVLWSVFGSEIICISSSKVSINKRIGNFGKPKFYDISPIRNFGILQDYINIPGQNTKRDPVLAFEYNGKTKSFAGGLPREELEVLLDEVWNAGFFDRDNYSDPVIQRKMGEETWWDDWDNWENREDKGNETGVAPTKSLERINADKEALAQDESLGRND